MHVNPPDTAEVFNGSHHPRYAEWLTLYLPNNDIILVTKLKAFADDKLSVAKMRISLFDRGENIEGKGENAGYQHFLLFPLCFPKPLL